tara:strand:+ start:379 stop:729 length:351 start_codon:yes stop_codon:yes gene_type:complete
VIFFALLTLSQKRGKLFSIAKVWMQSLVQETIQEATTNQTLSPSNNDELVSFIQEVPVSIKDAMSAFIEKYPNWDQYRLVQAAISGYLIQKGVESREINRIYFRNMFCRKAFGHNL